MSDSEIAQLCRKIYKQHRQALDLIYEHQPDFQLEIADFLQQLIQEGQEHNIGEDDCVKKMIRFAPKEWDDLEFQKTCQGWTNSNRILLFQFWNIKDYLGLGLVVGPGNASSKQKIYHATKKLNISGIKTTCHIKENGWSELFAVQILSASDYEDGDLEEVKKKIKTFFESFLSKDLQLMRKAITDLKPTEASEPSEVL